VKLKVLKKAENELRIEVEGEGHTFCNALQEALLRDEGVDFAGYTIPHPLVLTAIFYVRTKGGEKPEEALFKAAERVVKDVREFRELFEKAYEEPRK